MAGAVHGSGSWSGNPLLDALIRAAGPQMLPAGMVFGQLFPNQPLTDTLQARQFEEAQLGASSAMGVSGAEKHINELLMGYGGTGEGGLVGMGLLDKGVASGAQAGKVASNLSQLVPWVAGLGGSGVLDSLGLGDAASGSNYASAFRDAQAPYMNPAGGLSQDQLQQMAVSTATGVNRNLFNDNGQRRQTFGFGKGSSSALFRAGQTMGIAPSGRQMVGMGAAGRVNAATARTREFTAGASAIRDLDPRFAGLPPEQMLQMLDKLTMGRVSAGEDVSDLGVQMREFKQLARGADVGIEEGVALQQIAGAKSVELGGQARSGTVGGQHALAFGSFLQSEQGAGVVQGAGVSKSTLMQQDALLTAQAGRSDVGNQAAALMRMGEAGMLKGKSQQMFEALKEKGEFNSMTSGQFREMLKGSGVDMNAASSIMSQRETNWGEYGDQVAGAVREQQFAADIAPEMQRSIANQLNNIVGDKRSMRLGGVATEALRGMAGKDPAEMRKALIKKFEEAGLKGDKAASAAEVAFGAADVVARKKGYEGGIGNVAALHSRKTLEGVQQEEEIAEERAADEEGVAHMQQSAGDRIIDAVKRGDPSAARTGARMLGAVDDPASGDNENRTVRVEVVNDKINVSLQGDNDVPAADAANGASEVPVH